MRRCKSIIRGHVANKKGLANAHNYKYKCHQKDYVQHIKCVVIRKINGIAQPFVLEKCIQHYKG